MTSTAPPPDHVHNALDVLIARLWPAEVDDFRDNPHPDHPLLALARLLLWQAGLDQPQLAPAPRVCADLTTVMAVAAAAAVQMPGKTCWPATLLDVLARLLGALRSPSVTSAARPVWLATADGSTLPVHLHHELVRPADGLRARHVRVRVQAPAGAILASVEYRTDSELLRPDGSAEPRDISTIDDLLAALLTDINHTLASVWPALHGRPR